MGSLSFPFLAPGVFATLVFSLYFVPPGFLFAGLTDVAGFWERSTAEKLLWAVGLSFPVGAMTAVLFGHYIGQSAVNPVFLVYIIASFLLAYRRHRQGRFVLPTKLGKDLAPLLFALAGTVVFCIVATAAVRVHGRLYEGVFTNDWYIRIPLQFIAPKTGVPSINPLFTLAGQNPPLAYHYFFYVLCAQPMRLASLDARSALVASTAWACLGFFAVGWLMLKYLALPATGSAFQTPGEEPYRPSTRRMALLFFFVSTLIGLDLVSALIFLVHKHEIFAATTWLSREAIAAWPGWVMFGPHHMVGLTAGLMGYLLLALLPQNGRTWIGYALLASLCFASLLGTSAFLALSTVVSAICFGLDGLFRKNWKLVFAVAGSLLLAAALDGFFLIDLAKAQIGSAAPSTTATAAIPDANAPATKETAAKGHFEFSLTDWSRVIVQGKAAAHRLPAPLQAYGIAAFLFSAILIPPVYVLEGGIFAFVVVYQAIQGARDKLTPERRALWLLFLPCITLSLCISSAPMQGGFNDFGRNIALESRMVMMLWACPLIASAWHLYRRHAMPPRTRRILFVGVIFGVLGAAGTLYDVLDQRFFLPLVDRGVISGTDPFAYSPGFAADYAELLDAWQQIGAKTPPDAIIQHDLHGTFQRAALLYANRRIAAGDVACETTFGGNTATCVQSNVRPLLALYPGKSSLSGDEDLHVPPDDSAQNFDKVCQSLRLTALIATDYDDPWQHPNSWVWQRPALYAGQHVRVINCPAAQL